MTENVGPQVEGVATVNSTCIQGGWIGGINNIDADPMFVDPENGNFRLLPFSPAIDAGANGYVSNVATDLDGNPRIVDGLGDGVPVIDMGAYEVQQATLAVSFQIRPGSCPNQLNRRSNGILQAAVLGDSSFDPAEIDLNTIVVRREDRTGGAVAPLMGPPGPGASFNDVGTPFFGEACACDGAGPDGILDLSLKFSVQDLVSELVLDEMDAPSEVALVITGLLFDGTPFTGNDCIWITH